MAQRFELDEFKRFFRAVSERHAAQDGFTEIRLLREPESPERTGKNKKDVWSGLFRPKDADLLGQILTPLPGEPRNKLWPDNPKAGECNIYWGLNPVKPEAKQWLGLRRLNGPTLVDDLYIMPRTIKDSHIQALSMIPIDLDPIRPKKTSSTEEEKAKARALQGQIMDWLAAQGLKGVAADSGNGFHILLPITPIFGDDAIREASLKTRDFLRLLKHTFDNEAVDVDGKVWNASRIFKCYGTQAVKGEDLPSRPHRLATIDGELPEEQDFFGILKDVMNDWVESQTYQDLYVKKKARKARPSKGEPSAKPSKGKKPRTKSTNKWHIWRQDALDALDIDSVYKDILYESYHSPGWRDARDPWSPSGKDSTSGQVADGHGDAEKGTFHSFREEITLSVFDYLLKTGKASTNMEAFELIAQLSGVPTPEQRPPQPPPIDDDYAPPIIVSEPELPPWQIAARALNDWGKARLDKLPELLESDVKSGLRRDILLPLAQVSRWRRLPVLKVLSLALELTLPQIEDALYSYVIETNRDDLKVGYCATVPGRWCIGYLPSRDTTLDLFTKVVNILRFTERVFRYGKNIVAWHGQLGRSHYLTWSGAFELPEPPKTSVVDLRDLTAKKLSGYLDGFADFCRLTQKYDDDAKQWYTVISSYGHLPFDKAAVFLSNPNIINALPPLKKTSASPLFLRSWDYVGDRPGYVPLEGGILYTGTAIPPKFGHDFEHLGTLLKGFLWQEDADQHNFIAAMLTAITIPHWFTGHPILLFNGNRPGLGKTTLAQILAVLIDGHTPRMMKYSRDPEEFEKRIAAEVRLGSRILVVDNVKGGTVDSEVLDRIATSSTLAFRHLGNNDVIVREENDLIVCLTMNTTKLSQDGRRRSMAINLFAHDEPQFSTFDPIRYAIEFRSEILQELVSMVQAWIDGGRPIPENSPYHSTNAEWAPTMNGILKSVNCNDFLSNKGKAEIEFDPRFPTYKEILQEVGETLAITPTDWIDKLVEVRAGHFLVFKSKGRDRKGNRAAAIAIGKLFKVFLGVAVDVEGEMLELYQDYWYDAKQRPRVTYGIRIAEVTEAEGQALEEEDEDF